MVIIKQVQTTWKTRKGKTRRTGLPRTRLLYAVQWSLYQQKKTLFLWPIILIDKIKIVSKNFNYVLDKKLHRRWKRRAPWRNSQKYWLYHVFFFQCHLFVCRKKCREHFDDFCVCGTFERKGGDSNPWSAFNAYSLSRRASSTTRAPFRELNFKGDELCCSWLFLFEC